VFKKRAVVFIENGKEKEVFSVCEDIKKRDKSFDFLPLKKSILLYDRSKDRLHKRAMWMVKKVKGVKGYTVL